MHSPDARLQVVAVELDGERELLAQVDSFGGQVRYNIEGQNRADMLQVQLNLRRKLQEVRHEPEEVRRVDFQIQVGNDLSVESADERVVPLEEEVDCELFEDVGDVVVCGDLAREALHVYAVTMSYGLLAN